MDLQVNKIEVGNLLAAYSEALNSSNPEFLASLYIADGVFMPNSAPTLKGREAIRRSAERFLEHKQINIVFDVKDIVVDNDYAFVRITSICTTHQQSTGKEENSKSRDFFVLRKEQQQWMVFQYMFIELDRW